MKKEILREVTTDILNNLNRGEVAMERGHINDMGVWFDEIQPLIQGIADKHGITFEEAKEIYEQAWDDAFDTLENK